MKNRYLKIFTVMFLLVGMLLIGQISASAGIIDSGTCGENVTWTLDDEGTLTISGMGDMYDYFTPWDGSRYSITSVVIENGVTNIGKRAFFRCSNLKSVIIPNSVTDIGNSAFEDCSGIVNVNIPNSVQTIGSGAFESCESLESIIIPDSVISIGERAFYRCDSLVSAFLGKGIKSIGKSAFSWCDSLVEVTMSGDVISISDKAFDNCKALVRLELPESVTSIGDYAFNGCNMLECIKMPGNIQTMGVGAFNNCINIDRVYVDNIQTWYNVDFENEGANPLYNEAYLYAGDELVTDLVIEGVESIGSYAFYNCKGIENVEFYDDVKSIGAYAFYGCRDIKSIHIPKNITSIGEGAFAACASLEKINVSTYNEYYSAVSGVLFNNEGTTLICYPAAKNLKTYKIASNVEIIAKWAFSGNSSIESVVIPNSVTKIETGAFGYCDNLIDVELPMSVTSIASKTFYKCNRLESVEIPSSIQSIGSSAFSGCISILDINIPKTVESVGSNAFSGCASVVSVTVPENIGVISSGMFSGCESLESVTIEEGITEIADGAFNGCDCLESVVIPDSVTSLGSCIFEDCEGLKNVVLGAGVETVGYNDAFSWLENLESIEVSENNSYFSSEDGVLFDKDKTVLIVYPAKKVNEEYIIPNSVEIIENYAFESCVNLKKVVVPESVKQIYSAPWRDCNNLKSIRVDENNKKYSSVDGVLFNRAKTELLWYPAKKEDKEYIVPQTVTKLGYYVFDACSELVSLIISDKVISIDSYPFEKCLKLESITVDDNNPVYSSEDGVLYNKNKTVLIKYPLNKQGTEFVIPDSVKTIGERAFRNSVNLVNMEIPENVEVIRSGAFGWCDALETVKISKGLFLAKENAFSGNRKLISIEVDSDNEYYCSVNGVLFNKSMSKLLQYPAGNGNSSYTVPASVKCIDGWAFEYAEKLETISIPAGMDNIGYFAFYDCSQLSEVVYPTEGAIWCKMSIKGGNKPLINAYYGQSKSKPEIAFSETEIFISNVTDDCILAVAMIKGGVVTGTKTVKVSGDMEVEFSAIGLDTENATEIRAYLWESIATMEPLCKAQSLQLK